MPVTNPSVSEIKITATRPRFSLRFLFALVALVAVVCFALQFLLGLAEVPRNAYAMWAAGDLLLGYMEANSGGWPANWDALQNYSAQAGPKLVMVSDFEDVKRRVTIDFECDPDAALTTIGEFRPVRLRNGSTVHWEGKEPNERIVEYLRAEKYGYGRN